MSVVIFITAMFIPARGWLVHFDGPYQGNVLEDGTGKPIEGAVVLAVWHVNYGFPTGGHVSKFFDVVETVTDKRGRFRIDRIIGFSWWPFSSLKTPKFLVYLPGYDTYPNRFKNYINTSNKSLSSGASDTNVIFLKRLTDYKQRLYVVPGLSFSTELPPILEMSPNLKTLIQQEIHTLRNKLGDI